MFSFDGSNPLRWDCNRDGCFNVTRRPKLERFANCFPGRINFGDIDGLVELNGRFCVLEWKGEGGSLRLGQSIAYATFSESPGNIVFVVEGDAETMEVRRHNVFWAGRFRRWQESNLTDVKRRMRAWASHVQTSYVRRKAANDT